MTARVTVAWGVAILLASAAALAVALLTEAETGVVAEEPGGHVLAVDPGGIAWEAGIRPGQVVVLLHPAADPGGWALETTDADGTGYGVSAAAAEAPMRSSSLAALAGLAGAITVVGLAGRQQRRAEIIAVCAALLAGVPFWIAERSTPGMAVLLLGALGPLLWIRRWHVAPTRNATAIVLMFGLASAAVLAARAWMGTVTAPITGLWAGTVAALAFIAAGLAMGLTRASLTRALGSIRFLDVAVIAAAATAVIALLATGIPPLLAIAAVALALLGYARARIAISSLLDRAILTELREREAIRAVEEERARVSREIHDDPLQAIAGVIRQLDEPRPDTVAAQDSLRSVASRLRGVATELRPPALDDLGLVPALVAGARAPETVEVRMELDNRTGYARSERPPEDVELAVYRIAQEAIANADRHSGGRVVAVRGIVAVDHIDLEVHDDGRGITVDEVEAALRAGHLGIASMRRRAAAIGGRLDVDRSPDGGTSVRVRWPA